MINSTILETVFNQDETKLEIVLGKKDVMLEDQYARESKILPDISNVCLNPLDVSWPAKLGQNNLLKYSSSDHAHIRTNTENILHDIANKVLDPKILNNVTDIYPAVPRLCCCDTQLNCCDYC